MEKNNGKEVPKKIKEEINDFLREGNGLMTKIQTIFNLTNRFDSKTIAKLKKLLYNLKNNVIDKLKEICKKNFYSFTVEYALKKEEEISKLYDFWFEKSYLLNSYKTKV